MLPPVVIYKSESIQARETPETTGHYIQGVKCYKQKSNTMTSSIMVDYINNELSPLFNKQEKLLIMDSFSGHKTDLVKKALRDNGFDLLMIPGGYTAKLQPLDISVNRSFKSKLKWKKFMGNTSNERLLDLIQNVKKCSGEITEDCITNGFMKMRQAAV